ncbi:MAG: putative multidrug resistance ABC transporter ATP-binding/permease protein YheI [candidate division BRC1 bacterium ADurb.BinA364]|nr:MAG: putative multidrug resistance ABC transporter ATP-binding/permease protein YheI [candidate division BRC1 bacterium ADurb.BinA364]
MAHRAPKSKASLRSLLRLAPYIARYKWPFAWGMVCLVLCNAFAVWGWAWVMRAIDEFSLPGADKSLAGPMALTSLAIFGIGAVFRFEMRWLLSGISRLVEYDFRNDIFAHLARLSPSFYDRRMTGDLMARATNDLILEGESATAARRL